MSPLEAIKWKFEQLRPVMDERVCRLWAAAEAQALGWRLLQVQRSGDIGSPRVNGSTRASRSSNSVVSVSVLGLRPPPGRRTRPVAGWGAGDPAAAARSSRRPTPILLRLKPVACATRV